MNICSPPTGLSSISPASGSRCGNVYETRSRHRNRPSTSSATHTTSCGPVGAESRTFCQGRTQRAHSLRRCRLYRRCRSHHSRLLPNRISAPSRGPQRLNHLGITGLPASEYPVISRYPTPRNGE
jgi:hypothetical protein